MLKIREIAETPFATIPFPNLRLEPPNSMLPTRCGARQTEMTVFSHAAALPSLAFWLTVRLGDDIPCWVEIKDVFVLIHNQPHTHTPTTEQTIRI